MQAYYYYVELEKSDGTRARMPDGNFVDEERASLTGSGEQTVQALKECIFPGERKLGRVAMYAQDGAKGWIRKEPRDTLVANTLYGYVDARKVVVPYNNALAPTTTAAAAPPNSYAGVAATTPKPMAMATPPNNAYAGGVAATFNNPMAMAAMRMYQQGMAWPALPMARPGAAPPPKPAVASTKELKIPTFNTFRKESTALQRCAVLGIAPILYQGRPGEEETQEQLLKRLHTMKKLCDRARHQETYTRNKNFGSVEEAKEKCAAVGVPYVEAPRGRENETARSYRLHAMYMAYIKEKRRLASVRAAERAKKRQKTS